MANRLTMATFSAIDTLRRTGRSRRQVAQLLGIHRETVGKYFDRLQNQPNAPPGSDEHASDREAPAAPLVSPGPDSASEPFRDLIAAKLQQGLTGQRIYQDLVTEHGFVAKCHSVRRFVRKLLQRTDLPSGPGYPSSGCSPAEPKSVRTKLVFVSSGLQLHPQPVRIVGHRVPHAGREPRQRHPVLVVPAVRRSVAGRLPHDLLVAVGVERERGPPGCVLAIAELVGRIIGVGRPGAVMVLQQPVPGRVVSVRVPVGIGAGPVLAGELVAVVVAPGDPAAPRFQNGRPVPDLVVRVVEAADDGAGAFEVVELGEVPGRVIGEAGPGAVGELLERAAADFRRGRTSDMPARREVEQDDVRLRQRGPTHRTTLSGRVAGDVCLRRQWQPDDQRGRRRPDYCDLRRTQPA